MVTTAPTADRPIPARSSMERLQDGEKAKYEDTASRWALRWRSG